MTESLNLLTVGMILIIAIVLMWNVSIMMINSKKMWTFLPFFVVSISYCINAAFNFYEINDQRLWFIPELILAICFWWVLIILIRKNNV